jgi:hypothetical protein
MKNPFPPTSRYANLEVAELEIAENLSVAYLRRRFVPSPSRFALVQEHVVAEGERLDHITAHYLGDPEQFWRVCDANTAMRPEDLEAVGKRLRMTMPEGIPAPGVPDV